MIIILCFVLQYYELNKILTIFLQIMSFSDKNV